MYITRYNGACISGCSASNCGGCNTETACTGLNPTSDTFGCDSLTTSANCNANTNCKWYGGDISKCLPKTKCVYTGGHCCGYEEFWSDGFNM